MPDTLLDWLLMHKKDYYPIVDFDPAQEHLFHMDFTEGNRVLKPGVFNNTDTFSAWVNEQLAANGARYGYGGYAENRTVYSRSAHFGDVEAGEPRTLHLGVDIWGPAGTPVNAPIGGIVHSFGFNNRFGDYGVTIILSHSLNGFAFYTLYGHLSLADLENIREGQYVVAGTCFAHFGKPLENGHWPPHLHFQVIEHIGNYEGDYPGVCRLSEQDHYLANCPDPDLILGLRQYAHS